MSASRVVACTVVTGRTRAAGVVLLRSYRAQHDHPLVLCTLGTPLGDVELPPGTSVVDAEDLVDDLAGLGAEVLPEDLPAVILALLLRRELEGHGVAVALNPAGRVLGPVDALIAAAAEHGLAVLPAPGRQDHDGPAMPYDPGAFAVGGDAGRAHVSRWTATLEGEQEPYDQRGPLGHWLAETPGAHTVTGMATHLAGYTSAVDAESPAAPALLRCDGFDPRNPTTLGRRELRLPPELGAVVDRHAEELLAAGAAKDLVTGSSFVAMPDATLLDARLRRLFRRARRAGELGEAPFTVEAADAFVAWLNQPAAHGAAYGLTRYHETIWADSPGLQEAYPDLDAHGEGLAGWLWRFAGPEIPLPTRLKPPLPARMREPIYGDARFGVNVAGFFAAELGLGEAARMLIAGLDAGKVPALPVQGAYVPPTRQRAEFHFATPDDAPFPVNVLCLNGDSIMHFARTGGERLVEGRYNIALWWWEVDVFPDEWRGAFEHLDEIWVASDHIQQAIAPACPIPVHKVDLPVLIPDAEPANRAALGLPDDRFLFLFVWDYYSTEARKNPTGLVKAFKKAFPEPSDDGPALVLKCINAKHRPGQHGDVLAAIGDRPDVIVIDEFLDADVKAGLFGACDAYVSLHRSEGFGLTVAEAMRFGKPVIATRYGGVLEFLTDDNAFLVDHAMTAVGPDAVPYPPEATWAEPDLDHAARLMRQVLEDPEDATRRAARAAQDLVTQHSPAAVAPKIADRLRAIYEDLLDTEAHRSLVVSSVPPLLVDRSEIYRTPAEPAGVGLRARLARIVRRRAGGLLQPAIARQRHGDEILADAVERLDARVRELSRAVDARRAADHTDTLAGFRRLTGETRHDAFVGARTVRDLRHLTTEVHQHLAEHRAHTMRDLRHLTAEVDQHLAEHRSVPYTDGDTQHVRHDERFGEVLAFRSTGEADTAVYRSFEDVFRGTEERVRELQRMYVDLLRSQGPVFDVGCGRGELLDLLREADVEAVGVDLDEGMVERCRAKGHGQVRHGDAIEVLAGEPDGAFGAIFSAQVVEHIPYEALLRFITESRRALRDGGIFIAETVNPHAVHALKAFWVDPTHQHPLFPEVMLELCRISGFREGFIVHPNGTGDLETDRHTQPAYAVVATR